ncbi:hypothetical protein AVW11_04075 [Streptomyces amritsarensis]|uniref:Uncharacterized protein n=1 Tax=Streptomyces amritsarensis TaxID=681158 RepID=A0ABX3G8V4_9ACTN|nr:hypothetical protein [Streptomyces amritsarensis]OLZ72577.1 hypothetical protein AVW11_04075 [Streptomyces amritsarensis]
MKQIPVLRAELFYLPPPGKKPDAWAGVPPAELVWRWYEHKAQRRVRPPEGMLLGQSIHARINHGRWVADCVCGSAQVVTPADPRFACPECGYGWARVLFPPKPAAAEAEVADRAPHERNWWADDDPSWDRPAKHERAAEKAPRPIPGDPRPQPAPVEEQLPGRRD